MSKSPPPQTQKNGFKPLELDDKGRHHRMEFDGSDPNLYDMVLVVQKRKFHVSKTHLASHSDYFQKLFFEDEPDKTELTLLAPSNGNELQVFLETLHGVKCVTDYNVDGLLRLSRCWRVRAVRDQCEEFLVKSDWTQRSKKDTFALAVEFRLLKVVKKVLSSLKTPAQLNSILPESIADLDQEVKSLILQKSLHVGEVQSLPPPPPVEEHKDYLYPRRSNF